MTIHSAWFQVMKSECPQAFTPTPPFAPRAAFLDGMPLLMASSTMRKWDDLIRFNFCNPILRFFRMGAQVCVLAFDDYLHVPKAKAITQANRSKKKAPFQCNEREQLETLMPADYNTRLANRIYKRKVIDLIAETLVDHLALAPGQKLIVDYVECPVLFFVEPGEKKPKFKYLLDVPPLGECDIKFTRWSRHFGDMVAHSVDGDFVPIALLEYERQVRVLKEGGSGSRRPQQRHTAAKLAVFRLEYGAAAAASAAAAVAPPSSKKQKVGSGGSAASAAAGAEPPKSKKRKRTMEYVDIPLLYESLKSAMKQFSNEGILRWAVPRNASARLFGGGQKGESLHYMRILASMIGLTGTDFTRGLPQLGPSKVWDSLPCKGVWDSLASAYDPVTNSLDARAACDGFVAALYTEKFPNHVPRKGGGLADVLAQLRASKLSDKVKQQLPSEQRVWVTIGNCNWLMKYWECVQPREVPPPAAAGASQAGEGEAAAKAGEGAEAAVWDYSVCFPDPLCEQYGFRKSGDRKDAVQWWDSQGGE